MLYGLLNSNSTNVDLNQVVFAFNTLFNSAGILSMVNSLTITARILQIYDFPPKAVSRIETRIRNQKDREDDSFQKVINEEFRRNFTSSIDHGVDQEERKGKESLFTLTGSGSGRKGREAGACQECFVREEGVL